MRVYSPSRRRMRDKNNELFVKMKQIFVLQSDVPGSGRGSQLGNSFSEVVEENSPTIRKHESIFSRLFDREKSF